MIATIEHNNSNFKVDLSSPIDISIPLKNGKNNPTAWYVPAVKMEPVMTEDWVGEVKQGGSVNFFNIYFNPHGHGTHTESVGHISKNQESINECVKQYFFTSIVISVQPEERDGDLIITKNAIKELIKSRNTESIIIRTLPNSSDKKTMQYSNSNPPYMEEEAAFLLKELNIKHLLIDLPSVDREEDGGKLLAHHAFWDYPKNTRLDCSITELIYLSDEVLDGEYLLNLSFAPFENDASPSRPTLYKML